MSESGVLGGVGSSLDFGKSVNPEEGGADYAHYITSPPPDFQTFRHSWNGGA